MARYPELQIIYLSFSSHEQKLFPVSSIASQTFSPFPLPRYSLLVPHICSFCRTLSYCTHPWSTLLIRTNFHRTLPKGELLLPSSHSVPSDHLAPHSSLPREVAVSVQGQTHLPSGYRGLPLLHAAPPHSCTPAPLLLFCHRIQD